MRSDSLVFRRTNHVRHSLSRTIILRWLLTFCWHLWTRKFRWEMMTCDIPLNFWTHYRLFCCGDVVTRWWDSIHPIKFSVGFFRNSLNRVQVSQFTNTTITEFRVGVPWWINIGKYVCVRYVLFLTRGYLYSLFPLGNKLRDLKTMGTTLFKILPNLRVAQDPSRKVITTFPYSVSRIWCNLRWFSWWRH